MQHAILVNEKKLHAYAESNEYVEGTIPELIFRLTATCVNDIKDRRVPFGGSVNQPGVDVLLETDSGFLEFVPKGKSFWEVGTGKDPRDKANSDYRSRTKEEDLTDEEKRETTLVLVTPRSGVQGWTQAKQESWIEAKQITGPWKNIVVLDGTKLVQWLAFAPGVDLWLSERMGDTTAGVESISSIWNGITALSVPPLKPKLFIERREAAVKSIRELGSTKSQMLRFRTDYPDEIPAFMAAAIESLDTDESAALAGRTIVVNNVDTWRNLCEHNKPLVLVAGPRLNWEAVGQELSNSAKAKGHSVVFGSHRQGVPGGIQLELNKHREFELRSLLEESGIANERARDLAQQAQGSIPILLRTLAGNPASPDWAREESAASLVPALLAGKWLDANVGDREVLSEIAGRPYGDYRDIIRPFGARPDPPLSSHDKKWIFISPREGILFLAHFADTDMLDRFRKTSLRVLGEIDPALELEKDERFAAAIHDKTREYSALLIEGVANSLAMLGNRSREFTSCGPTEASGIAASVVRELLADTTWQRWASVNSILPLLAEAAPEVFLEAVRNAIQADPNPFPELFRQEGNHALGGTNYLTGLWWALETLAWEERYLIPVCHILAELDTIDPDGNWSNRPGNSMREILLPWFPQTCAPYQKRLQAVEAVINRHPEAGWDLLTSLIPSGHDSSSGTHKPAWRDSIPADWSDKVRKPDYLQEIRSLIDMAIREARNDTEKLVALVSRLDDLPPSSRAQVLEYCKSESVLSLAEPVRRPIWEALVKLASKHGEYAEAEWALPRDQVEAIELVADSIKPTSAFFLERRLFSEHDASLYESRSESGTWKERQEKLANQRTEAMQRVMEEGGLDGVLRFAAAVGSPWKAGFALGAKATPELDQQLFPLHLDDAEDSIRDFMYGYIWHRQQEDEDNWVESLKPGQWTIEQQVSLLRGLPFCTSTWDRVDSFLGDKRELYWNVTSANAYEAGDDLLRGIEALIEHGRFCLAVHCLERGLHEGSPGVSSTHILCALEGLLDGEEILQNKLDSHSVIELIKHLQSVAEIDQRRLALIEWHLLPLLDRYSGGSPKTLERQLAEDPEFFCEVLSFIYRSSKEGEEDPEQTTENRRHLARVGYRLLHHWRRAPGVTEDEKLDEGQLIGWLNRVKELCSSSGRLQPALSRIGHVLGYAYRIGATELWINPAIARILDDPDHKKMRRGFTCELMNKRGTHGFTAGREEREFAEGYRKKASAIDGDFPNLAASMRQLADYYEHDAERDAIRDPWDD